MRLNSAVTRDPDEAEQQSPRGGRAAERLREFLAARFGSKAPTIPPDELPPADELADEPAHEERPDAAGAPPPGR